MITLVVAVTKNNGIGYKNDLCYKTKEDLAFFKKLTINSTIVMGRKTFDSLPGILPNRIHYVISSNIKSEPTPTLIYTNTDPVNLVLDLNSRDDVYVIGGGKIYEQTIHICDQIWITRFNIETECDTYFPEIPDTFILKEEIIIDDITSRYLYSRI
jgi:dihydrofolate reductase